MDEKADDRVLLTDVQVAYFLGLSIHSLRSARSNKPNLRMPPHIKIGGRVRYDLDALLDWLLERGVVRIGPGS